MPFDEKRSHIRYACDGGVEVRPEGSTGGFWGTLTDISLGGCYVQTFSPLAVGTQLTMRVQTKMTEFRCSGSVQASHPGVGMGIIFGDFEQGQKELMDALIKLLAVEAANKR
jgi:hypothetical protein